MSISVGALLAFFALPRSGFSQVPKTFHNEIAQMSLVCFLYLQRNSKNGYTFKPTKYKVSISLNFFSLSRFK